MTYTMQFLDETGGTPLELRGTADLRIAEALFATARPAGNVVRRRGISVSATICT